jgi:hypothetical protein
MWRWAASIAFLGLACSDRPIESRDQSLGDQSLIVDLGVGDLVRCGQTCGTCAANEVCYPGNIFVPTCLRLCKSSRDCDSGQRCLSLTYYGDHPICVSEALLQLCGAPQICLYSPMQAMDGYYCPYCADSYTLGTRYSSQTLGCGTEFSFCPKGCATDGGVVSCSFATTSGNARCVQ